MMPRVVLALALLAGLLEGQPSRRAAGAEVLALHLRKFEWMVANDTVRLMDLLLPDARIIHSNGIVQRREDVLTDARTGRLVYREIVPHDTAVRLYGDHTAIITGRMQVKGAVDGTEYETELLYTETYVRRAGRWRLASRHASRAPGR